MKKSAVLIALVALLLQAVAAFAQSSDYEIIETFKKSHQALLASIKAVQDPAQCISLDGEIGRLESEYGQHRKLLAEGLYPETLDTAIAELRDRLKKATERVNLVEEGKKDKATIEVIAKKAETAEKRVEVVSRQNEEYKASIDKLNLELKDLTAQLQRLSDENAGLLEKVKALQLENKKDKESIARLKGLTEKLTANIRDRDELIIAMMDSLFKEYAKAGLTDVQRKNLFVNAQGNDYVGKIIATVDENIKYAEGSLLSPQDVALARGEQAKLALKWDEIKPHVARLYPDETIRTRDIATVDSRVSDWKKSIADATWRSVNLVFVGQGVDIGAFQSAEEFTARLTAYLDAQLKNPSRETYATFKGKVWDSPFKDQWLPVIPTDELTAQQRTAIEERISQWDKAISAIVARRRMLYGVGAAVLIALVALAVVLGLKKKKPDVTGAA